MPDLCAVDSAAGKGLWGEGKPGRKEETAHRNFLSHCKSCVCSPESIQRELLIPWLGAHGGSESLRGVWDSLRSPLSTGSQRAREALGKGGSILCVTFLAQSASPYTHQHSDSPPMGWTHLWGRIVIESLSDDHKQLKVPCSVVRPIVITQKPCPPPLKEAS